MGSTPYVQTGLGSDTDFSAEQQFYFAKKCFFFCFFFFKLNTEIR